VSSGDELWMWTVFCAPADYPGAWVVRASIVVAGAVYPVLGPLWPWPSLTAARLAIPPGLHRMARHPDDEPTIAEVWL
jgi:hypothetical protein